MSFETIFLSLQEQHRPIEVEQPPAAEVVGVNTSKDSIEDVATAPFEDKKGKGNKIPFQ